MSHVSDPYSSMGRMVAQYMHFITFGLTLLDVIIPRNRFQTFVAFKTLFLAARNSLLSLVITLPKYVKLDTFEIGLLFINNCLSSCSSILIRDFSHNLRLAKVSQYFVAKCRSQFTGVFNSRLHFSHCTHSVYRMFVKGCFLAM